MNCSVIDVDVKFYAAGTAITITDPIDGSGNYDPSGFDLSDAAVGQQRHRGGARVLSLAALSSPASATTSPISAATPPSASACWPRPPPSTSSPERSMTSMQKMSLRIRELISGLRRDDRGNAAVEFAIVVPIMLTLFFGVVEFSSGVAVDRKVTMVARTLSDLTSQSSKVTDTDIANFTITAKAIMTPYPSGLAELDDHGTVCRPHDADRQGQVEQGIGGAWLRHHRRHPDRAQDRRHLSDLFRGRLHLHADGRLRHEDRHQAQRLHVTRARAMGSACCTPPPPTARSAGRMPAFPNNKKGRAIPHGLSSHSVEFREKLAAELRQPAARKLSAEDLPERRSATIS